jgi:hypothetical protein
VQCNYIKYAWLLDSLEEQMNNNLPNNLGPAYALVTNPDIIFVFLGS